MTVIKEMSKLQLHTVTLDHVIKLQLITVTILTRMCIDGAPSHIPALKFLTHQHPQVPPLGHDPSNGMKILLTIFSIFYL